jgi:hypothetical protein
MGERARDGGPLRPGRAAAWIVCLLLFGAGCEAGGADVDGLPGAELLADAARADDGYDPAELAWLRDGRPVKFGGRNWRPVGRPVYEPRRSMRPVGEFEGMTLYATRLDRQPYAHLFFPLGKDRWQVLEPSAGIPPRAQSPRLSGVGRSPE